MASDRSNKGKLIGGFFDPAISKTLGEIALHEGKTRQALLAEAIDMLFVSRRMAPVAAKWNADYNAKSGKWC